MKCNYKPKDKLVAEASLYDINCALIAQMPELTTEEIETVKSNVILPFVNNQCIEKHNHYFMLLCKELSYYTVFALRDIIDYPHIENEIINCLADLGNLVDSTFDNKENPKEATAVENWIKDKDGKAHCVYLFPYDKGVIECC